MRLEQLYVQHNPHTYFYQRPKPLFTMNTKKYLIHLSVLVLLGSAFMAYILWHVAPEVIILAFAPLISWLTYLWARKARGTVPFSSLSLPLFLLMETLLLALFVFGLRVLVVHDFPVWSYIVLLVLYLDFSFLLFKEYRSGLQPIGRTDRSPA